MRFVWDTLLSAVCLLAALALVTWLSGRDYLTWTWFGVLLGILMVSDAFKILWRRRRGRR